MSATETNSPPPFNRSWQRPLTSLIGRDAERDLIFTTLLQDDTRLVTLLGPGGVGKTRLALAVAEEALTDQGIEVVFVDLSPVVDSLQVLDRIASAIGLSEEAGSFSPIRVAAALTERTPLLILDNMEHVIAAAPMIADLLAAAPGTTFLVTSRIPLRISGERQVAVSPLSLPQRGRSASLDEVTASPAISLFVQRARTVQPGFVVTEANRADIVEICQRIDGLPLAIELAAARSRVLSPAALLSRLTRLAVLGHGLDDLPERQQTMRNAIAWSVDLLEPLERELLHRLSVFAGSFSVTAVEAVCPDLHADMSSVLDQLTSLVEKSLVQTMDAFDGENRMRLLETVRAFAREELDVSDLAAVRNRHALFFAAFAAKVESELMGSDQTAWFARTDLEHDNLRGALSWFIERGDGVEATRMVGNLWPFWFGKGLLAEARRWLETVTGMSGELAPDIRARAFNGLGAVCHAQGDATGAVAACEMAGQLWRSAGDRRAVGSSLNNLAILAERGGRYDDALRLGLEALDVFVELDDRYRMASVLANLAIVARVTGDGARARVLDERALGIRRAINDTHGIASSLHNIGIILADSGDLNAAASYQREASELFNQLGDPRMVATTLNSLGTVMSGLGDLSASDTFHRQALAIVRETDDRRELSSILHNLGMNANARRDHGGAMTFFRQCLEIRREHNDLIMTLTTLEAVARVANDAHHPEVAVSLLAFTGRMRDETTYALDLSPVDLVSLKALMSAREYRVAMEIGQQATFATIVDLALAYDPVVSRVDSTKPVRTILPRKMVDHGLTTRELAVLRLITEGKSNAAIGEALFISPLTAKTHVGNLLHKLSLDTRAAAATFAAHHGII